jgi:hypothetical protein
LEEASIEDGAEEVSIYFGIYGESMKLIFEICKLCSHCHKRNSVETNVPIIYWDCHYYLGYFGAKSNYGDVDLYIDGLPERCPFVLEYLMVKQ